METAPSRPKSEPREQISPSLDSLPTSAPAALPTNTERLRSLRIHVELLDRLMNLVGELTLIRNQAQGLVPRRRRRVSEYPPKAQ